MAFAGGVVAAVAAMRLAVVDQLDPRRLKRRIEPPQHFSLRPDRFLGVHRPYIEEFNGVETSTECTGGSKGRGRIAPSRAAARPANIKAPLQPANFDGPGSWRFLCLDHVREHNAKYNFFDGMSPEEISEAQSPLAGWDRPSRKFAANGADPPPSWSDFADPLDAISGRFGAIRDGGARRASARPSGRRCRCSGSARTPTAMRCARPIRPWFAAITPTRTAATAPTRRASRAVIEAYQLLRKSRGFRLIAVGRAEREISAVGPRALDRLLHRRMGEQPGAIGLQPRTRVADLVDPVGVE